MNLRVEKFIHNYRNSRLRSHGLKCPETIVQFYGILRHFWEGQDKPEFGLVFEWCGIPTTPLHLAKTMVQLHANLSSLLFQTAEALEFMHGKGFIHRDIKPQNVLVAIPDPDAPDKWEKAVAKLADFATVKRFIKSVFS